jgi:hypothetical protein
MDEPEPSRRRRLDLPAITILAALAVVVCFTGWKWAESASRSQLLDALIFKGAMATYGFEIVEWSSDWPFHNVPAIDAIYLHPKMYGDDDVRRLRRAFPGVPMSEHDPTAPGRQPGLVKLPED